VLVAGEDGFDAEHHRTVSSQRALLDQRGGIALRRGQGMVVADQTTSAACKHSEIVDDQEENRRRRLA
jgi:DNA-binding transcriptional regulator YhcF (GntR family)